MFKRAACLICALCLMLTCAFAEMTETEDAVIAEIDGTAITRSQLDALYESRYGDYEPADDVEAVDIRMELLDSMLQDRCEQIMLDKLGLDEISDEERASLEEAAKLEFEEYVQYFMYMLNDGTLGQEELHELALSWLESMDMSEDDYVEQYISTAAYDRLYEYATQDILLTEEELQKYYSDMVDDARATYQASPDDFIACAVYDVPSVYVPEGVRVIRRILVSFDLDQSARYADLISELASGTDVSAEIDTLYAELEPRVDEIISHLDNGMSFIEVEQMYSDDATLYDTGLEGIGYYVCPDCTFWDEELVETALEMVLPGDISNPVRMADGISIFLFESELESGAVPYEDVEDYVVEAAYYMAGNDRYFESLAQWREELGCEIYLDALE